jgi:hypothetical protein
MSLEELYIVEWRESIFAKVVSCQMLGNHDGDEP